MRFDHLHHLKFEVCIKHSSGFLIAHGFCHFGFNNLSGCLFLLDHHKLERENKELRRANEILKLASAFFAQAELDRRLK